MKKSCGLLKQLLLFSFITLLSFCFINLENEVQARDEDRPNTSLNDTWLSAESMLTIFENLKFETSNSGEINFAEYITGYEKGTADYYVQSQLLAYNYSTTFNAWFNNYNYNYDITIGNLIFYWNAWQPTTISSDKGLIIMIDSGTSIYVADFIPIFQLFSDDISVTGNYNFFRWKEWTFDANNNKTGYNTQQASNNFFFLNSTSVVGNNLSSTTGYQRYYIRNFYLNMSRGTLYSTCLAYLTFNNQNREGQFISAVKYQYKLNNTTYTDYNFYSNVYGINLGSGEVPTPTPTGTGIPIPTTTGGGGGGSTTDYVQGNKDYWGEPNELNGETQETEIENAVNDLMESISGDMTQLQVYEQLSAVENGFLNFFTPNQNELFYDLKISWNDIKYQNKTIISAGEINFSKLCRDIEILGRIRTTLRAIINFWIVFALISQIWNLILATLGIDNPFLYENPDEESINYTIDENAGTITQTKRVRNLSTKKRWRL